MDLRVKASDESMQAVNDFIHSIIPKNCDPMVLNQIDLAVEEIFVNIAHYSGAEEADISADIVYGGDDKALLKLLFKDSGTPFNPLAKEDPDITLSAEERKIGGLGIFLTKKFMDSVDYEFINGKNCLKIQKSIQL